MFPFKINKSIKALFMGGIIALICYILMSTILVEPKPLQQAILAGLLAAEVMILSGGNFPNMSTVTL